MQKYREICKPSPAFLLLLVSLALFFSFLLTPCAFAELESPQLISSAEYSIIDSQTVSANGGQMTQLNISHSLPFGISAQVFPENSQVVSDKYGNPSLSIRVPKPPSPFNYVVDSTVKTYRTHVLSLPQSYLPPENQKLYLQSDGLVDASSSEIIELAAKATENATSKFEKAALLALFVHNRMKYDASLAGREVSAKEILADSRGVCTEYTTLYISLVRASGIPARYVSGFAYSDMFGSWLGHSWAEVYLGEWVGVDPTWLEVGDIDATHIAVSRKPDLGFSTSSVSALVYPPSASISFDSKSGSGGIRADNVKLIDSSAQPPDSGYVLAASSQQLPPGGKFIAYLSFPSSEYRLLPATLLPCKGQYDLAKVNLPQRNAITAPNSTAIIVWEGTVQSDLPENYRFSCPLSLNSPYLSLKSIPINITTAEIIDWPKINANIEDPRPSYGSNQSVHVSYEPKFAGKRVTLISGNVLQSQEVRNNTDTIFIFPSGAPGAHKAYVFGPIGDPASLEYYVMPSTGYSISILGLNRSAYSGMGNNVAVSVFAPPQFRGKPAAISIEWNGQVQESGEFNLSENATVRVPFTPNSQGSHLLIARLVVDGLEHAGASEMVSAQLPPSAEPYRVWSDESEGGNSKVTFRISRTSGVQALTLRVGDKEVSVPADTATIELPYGAQTGTLSWQAGGSQHSREFNFTVGRQLQPNAVPSDDFINGFVEYVSAPKSMSQATAQSIPISTNPSGSQVPTSLLCPIAILLIFIPVALAMRLRKGELP